MDKDVHLSNFNHYFRDWEATSFNIVGHLLDGLFSVCSCEHNNLRGSGSEGEITVGNRSGYSNIPIWDRPDIWTSGWDRVELEMNPINVESGLDMRCLKPENIGIESAKASKPTQPDRWPTLGEIEGLMEGFEGFTCKEFEGSHLTPFQRELDFLATDSTYVMKVEVLYIVEK